MSHWQQQPEPYQTDLSFPPLPPLPGHEQQFGPPPGYGPHPGYGPPPPGYGAPPPPRGGSTTGLWIGLGAGAVVLMLVVAGLGAFFLLGDDDSPRGTNPATNDPGEHGAAGPPPSGGISTPPPAAGAGGVGTPAKLANLEFTVTAKPSCGTDQVPGVTSRRGQLCLLPITVVNKGSGTVRWSAAYVSLYVTQKDYHSASLTCGNAARLETGKSLGAGQSSEAKVCFDIPTGQAPVRVGFTEQNKGDEVFVDL